VDNLFRVQKEWKLGWSPKNTRRAPEGLQNLAEAHESFRFPFRVPLRERLPDLPFCRLFERPLAGALPLECGRCDLLRERRPLRLGEPLHEWPSFLRGERLGEPPPLRLEPLRLRDRASLRPERLLLHDRPFRDLLREQAFRERLLEGSLLFLREPAPLRLREWPFLRPERLPLRERPLRERAFRERLRDRPLFRERLREFAFLRERLREFAFLRERLCEFAFLLERLREQAFLRTAGGGADVASSPQETTTTCPFTSPDLVPLPSMARRICCSSLNSLPKTTCLRSRWGVGLNKMKNCEPLVFGPALAMDNIPLASCFFEKFSSANVLP